jgi:tol-pal system beta propeller repeat protein TolB
MIFINKVLIGIFFALLFVNAKAEKSIDSIIEDSIQKVYVQRDLNEKDIILFGKFNVVGTMPEDGQKIAIDIRNQIVSLLSNRPNILPVLEEKVLFTQLKTPITDYTYFKQNNISYIITGDLIFKNSKFYLQINIFDSYKMEQILEQEFEVLTNSLDFFSKKLATQVYEFLTGEFGFFYGKLLYTVTERPGVRPFKKIVLSKKEGNSINATMFFDGSDIAFSPTYCYSTKEVFFVSQKPKSHSNLLIANRVTSRISKLNIPQFKNTNKSLFSPDLSKDCNNIVFSVSENGSSKLFLFDRLTSELKFLTGSKGTINTSAKFFDDDKKIIFISNNFGSPKIWKINTNGTGKEMLIKNEGSYYAPSVSNDNQKIAFVKIYNKSFYLGIANIDGSKEELLYSGFLIEDPIWSPIGKTIIFSMKPERNSQSRIYAISLNGREPEQLETLSGDVGEPILVDEF